MNEHTPSPPTSFHLPQFHIHLTSVHSIRGSSSNLRSSSLTYDVELPRDNGGTPPDCLFDARSSRVVLDVCHGLQRTLGGGRGCLFVVFYCLRSLNTNEKISYYVIKYLSFVVHSTQLIFRFSLCKINRSEVRTQDTR